MFDTLPIEITYYILTFLSETDKFYFSITNKDYYYLFCPVLKGIEIPTSEIIIGKRIKNCHKIYSTLLQTTRHVEKYNLELFNFIEINNIIDPKGIIISSNNVIRILKKLGLKLKLMLTDTHHFYLNVVDKKNNVFNLKLYPFNNKIEEYSRTLDKNNPIFVDINVSILLKSLVINKKTQHLLVPITYFITHTKMFYSYENNSLFTDKYKDESYDNFSLLFVTEPFDTDLQKYIEMKPNDNQMIIIIFQVLHALAVIHKEYPTFKHNELKPKTIKLVYTFDDTISKYKYELDNITFMIPNVGISVRIDDFDFSSIDDIIGNNLLNQYWIKKNKINKEKNQYYDVNLFLNHLLLVDNLSVTMKDFCLRNLGKYMIGSQFNNSKGRLLVDDQLTTPYEILMKDPLFREYRIIYD